MTDEIKLRRTQLSVPASNPRFVEKAATSGADEAFLDLDDSVPSNAKRDARTNVVEGLVEGEWEEHDTLPAYRMNGVDTRWWYDDVIEVVGEAGAYVDTIILPMVNDAGAVESVDNLLTQVEVNSDLPVGGIGLQCLIEDAEGMTNVREIATASDRIEALLFGPGDYTASVGAAGLTIGSGEGYPGHYWHYQLARIVHVAKAHGIQVIDGAYADIEDEEGLRESCRNAARLGVDGKLVVHPGQIEPVNEAFSPSREEADRARRVVEEYERATEGGSGAVRIDGEMVDEATRKMAAGIVKRAEVLGMYD